MIIKSPIRSRRPRTRTAEVIVRYVHDDVQGVVRLEVDAAGFAALTRAVETAVNQVATLSSEESDVAGDRPPASHAHRVE